MNQHSSTIDRVRQLMAPGNPAPPGTAAGSWDDELGRQAYQRIVATSGIVDSGPAAVGGRRSRQADHQSPWRARAWRILAPVSAGLVVAGLAVGLTVATGSHSGQPGARTPAGEDAPVTAGMPPLYVTLSQDAGFSVIASVHSSQTGKVLSQVTIGPIGSGLIGIAAEPSGRAFIVYRGIATYLLRVSDGGRSARLQQLRLALVPRGSNEWVEGIAVSPSGTKLAAVLQPPTGTLTTHAEIRVYSLTGGPTRTWTAPADPGEAWSPVWTGPAELTFVWQDHLYGNAQYFYLGNSEIRALDTSAPGNNFLRSTVIAKETGKLSLIQSAGAGQADSPLAAAVTSVTSVGGTGTEILRLEELSATGSVTKILTSSTTSYSGESQEGGISSSCQIMGVAADGAMLAKSPHFGRIVDGTFTPLPHNSGVFAAAW
jgi:hypothetical protein